MVAQGTQAQIQAVRSHPGVTYVEAAATLTGADGSPLTGKGVSVAVIDSGVDPTHPYFKGADGSSAVVANLKALCAPIGELCTVQRMPGTVDTDTLSVGGHGTHVSGIVAGRPTTLTDGGRLQGAAPGAKLVSISTGAGIVILGADSALNWVLENHAAPCGPGVPASTCPPIKVTNNSYGPTGGGEFDPESATVKLQRALVAEGVASFFDQDTGTRDGVVSDHSSRGAASDASTWPDISAPGENITSSCRIYLAICSTGLAFRNGPGLLDIGTSMAAPHIAGIVAQLFQADPTATPADIERALKVSAQKFTDGAAYQSGALGTTSYDKGYGLVDVVAAVAALG